MASNLEQMAKSCTAVEHELECPVCFKFMEGNIYQCQEVHPICGDCKPKLNECPSCRQPLGEIRNRSLEHIAEGMYRLCVNGCKATMTMAQRKDHAFECKKREIKCPDCTWSGGIDLFRVHMKGVHFEFIFRLNSPFTIIFDTHLMKLDQWHEWYRVLNDHAFKFRVRISSGGGGSWVCARLYATRTAAERYELKLRIESAVDSTSSGDGRRSPRRALESTMDIHCDLDNVEGQCIPLPSYDWLKKNGFLGDNEILRLSFTVFEVSANGFGVKSKPKPYPPLPPRKPLTKTSRMQQRTTASANTEDLD